MGSKVWGEREGTGEGGEELGIGVTLRKLVRGRE